MGLLDLFDSEARAWRRTQNEFAESFALLKTLHSDTQQQINQMRHDERYLEQLPEEAQSLLTQTQEELLANQLYNVLANGDISLQIEQLSENTRLLRNKADHVLSRSYELAYDEMHQRRVEYRKHFPDNKKPQTDFIEKAIYQGDLQSYLNALRKESLLRSDLESMYTVQEEPDDPPPLYVGQCVQYPASWRNAIWKNDKKEILDRAFEFHETQLQAQVKDLQAIQDLFEGEGSLNKLQFMCQRVGDARSALSSLQDDLQVIVSRACAEDQDENCDLEILDQHGARMKRFAEMF